MKDRTRGTAEMTAAMVISGTVGWFVVEAGRPVLDVVFWRCAFGAAAMLALCAALGLLRPLPGRRVLGVATLLGAAMVVNWVLLFAAYSRASIAVATAVYNTQPFMLVGLGAFFLGERPGAGKLAWLGLAFAGMMAIVQGKASAGYVGTDYAGGILLALGAAFFYAVAALLTKRLAGTPPPLLALVQVLVGMAMLAPFASLGALPEGPRTWGILVTLGAVHTGLMYILLFGAIQRLPTHLTGALSFIYPVAAIAVDYLAFGNRLQPVQLLGAAAILLAAAGMTLGWSLRKPRPA